MYRLNDKEFFRECRSRTIGKDDAKCEYCQYRYDCYTFSEEVNKHQEIMKQWMKEWKKQVHQENQKGGTFGPKWIA